MVELTREKFENEVSLHEAAHLVMQLLVLSEFDTFKHPVSIIFKISNVQVLASVNGFIPLVDGFHPHTANWYNAHYNNPTNTYLKCMTLLAGYTSYIAYVNETDDYISQLDNIYYRYNQQFRVRYFSFFNAPHYGAYGIGDKASFYSTLAHCGFQSKEGKDGFYEEIHPIVLNILKNELFDKAVNYVAVVIREKNALIENEEFISLCEVVKEIIAPLKITQFISEQEIEDSISKFINVKN